MAKVKKQKKDRRRINPLDVVIILLVLCLIAVFVYRLYEGIATPSFNKNSEFELSFVCEDEYNSMIKYLEDGDAVYLASTGELLGYLYKKNEGDALVSVITNSEDPNSQLIDFSGKLLLNDDADAVSSGIYYQIGDFKFSKGSKIEVYTERASFTITVSDVKPVE